jgi:hypothetical protein
MARWRSEAGMIPPPPAISQRMVQAAGASRDAHQEALAAITDPATDPADLDGLPDPRGPGRRPADRRTGRLHQLAPRRDHPPPGRPSPVGR